MKLKWLYFVGFYLLVIGLISNTCEAALVTNIPDKLELQTGDILNPFGAELGITLSEEARIGRTQISTVQRQKLDRSFKLDDLGLIFLSCKLTRSYSETSFDKYYLQLIGRSIQVNAP